MMLKRFERDVCDTDPGCVVILAGVNDVAGNDGAPKTTEEILANIRAMAERADAAGIPVIICSPLPQYTIDGVHASPEAYTVMEGIVTPIIEGI